MANKFLYKNKVIPKDFQNFSTLKNWTWVSKMRKMEGHSFLTRSRTCRLEQRLMTHLIFHETTQNSWKTIIANIWEGKKGPKPLHDHGMVHDIMVLNKTILLVNTLLRGTYFHIIILKVDFILIRCDGVFIMAHAILRLMVWRMKGTRVVVWLNYGWGCRGGVWLDYGSLGMKG